MEIKEKIKKVYQKNNIIVNDETVKAIMQDKERTKGLMKLYKDEEIESMNYIFGKSKDNMYFTQLELEIASKIDLFNRRIIPICREIYKNRNNAKRIEEIMKKLKLEVNV